MKKLAAVFLVLLLPILVCAAPKMVKFSSTSSFKSQSYLVDLKGDFEYKAFWLKHPDRFIVDFENVSLATPISMKHNSHSPVKSVRYATHKNFFRMVFDTKAKLAVSVHRVPSNTRGIYQLAIDFQKPQHAIYNHTRPHKPATKKKTRHETIDKSLIKAVKKTKKPLAVRDIVIVIDPGHGGKDPGASGKHGAKEKNVVLAIAKKLSAEINREPGFKAILTRRHDRYIGLRQRLNLAHKYKADMFVAIHADAYRNSQAHGASVYALSERGATSEAARWIAQKENESEFVGGLDLGDKDYLVRSVLIDLSQTHAIGVSLQMGSDILNEIGRFTGLHHVKVEQAAFVVLKSPDIPSLLVETGFLSNGQEERKLTNPHYQDKIAAAVKRGIKQYFVIHPPRGTELAFEINETRSQKT